MKKQLLKKIYAFIVPIAFGMMFFTSANAQIVYTDVSPDVTIDTNGGVYALDLNNDGLTDYNITFTTRLFASQTNKYILITPLGANKIGTSYIYPNALTLNTLIDSSSFTWLSTENQSLIQRIWFLPPRSSTYIWQYRGNWNGVSNRYIPLQLDLSSQKIYGWARLDVAANAASFTVKDYAYNSMPNQPILAGDTINFTTGIIENIASSINIFPNPANNLLTIALSRSYKNVEVTIMDHTGKIIYSDIAKDTQEIDVNTHDFEEGIYFVQIQTEELFGTKKIIVKK